MQEVEPRSFYGESAQVILPGSTILTVMVKMGRHTACQAGQLLFKSLDMPSVRRPHDGIRIVVIPRAHRNLIVNTPYRNQLDQERIIRCLRAHGEHLLTLRHMWCPRHWLREANELRDPVYKVSRLD